MSYQAYRKIRHGTEAAAKVAGLGTVCTSLFFAVWARLRLCYTGHRTYVRGKPNIPVSQAHAARAGGLHPWSIAPWAAHRSQR
jgi:hypothetical protein